MDVTSSYILYSSDPSSNATNNSSNTTASSDPVRWWPSGVPQALAIIGSSLITLKILSNSVSPRQKVILALAASGAYTATIGVTTAIENSVGLQSNRFIFNLTEYNRTGRWPPLDSVANNIPLEKMNDLLNKLEKAASNNNNNGSTSASFYSHLNQSSSAPWSDDNIINYVINTLLSVLKTKSVEGHLDDLIGQQLFIIFCLFFLVLCTLVLFWVYVLNTTLLHYKEYFLKRFTNKWFIKYIQYQILLTNISIIILPLFIFFYMGFALYALHFLITHQIPYENLGIDLHTYVKRK
jgi:hypothetical protein